MSRELVVGVDPSSKALALVARNPVVRQTFIAQKVNLSTASRYSPQNTWVALKALERFIEQVDRMTMPGAKKHVFIEEPVVAGRSRGIKSTIVQAYINGVIQAAFYGAGFEVHHVYSSTWKSKVCGKGNATKPKVTSTIKTLWPKLYNAHSGDQDLMDAGAIALYGEGVVKSGRRVSTGG